MTAMKALKPIIFLASAALILSGCDKSRRDTPEEKTYSKVMIMYSAGFNSLSSYLEEDIEDLQKGYLPSEDDDNAIFIISHLSKGSAYSYPTSPYLIRLYKDKNSNPVMDTLVTYPPTDLLVQPDVMQKALTYIRDGYKSDSYGFVVSSHGTGWLPVNYYNSGEPSSSSLNTARKAARRYDFSSHAEPYVELELPGPKTKTFGQEYVQTGTTTDTRTSYEMTIQDFASSIPMYMDYILMDACLMGGIEVAYELKDVCRYLAFSQAEVLADGLDYPMLTTRLLAQSNPDVKQVCADYFEQYDVQTGTYRSATISLIDCDGLGSLASACKDVIEAHRDGLEAVNPSDVQGYFRSNKHWFYDLRDVLDKAGMTSTEATRLDAALSSCVLYNQCTPSFISFDINTHCGLSMYLPKNGSAYLDEFYKTLAWNKAVGLVQ